MRVVFLMSLLVLLGACQLVESTSNSLYRGTPTVRLVGSNNAADYQVVSSGLGVSALTSSYVYGVIEVDYRGLSDRVFLAVSSTFKRSDGSVILKDMSYLCNSTVTKVVSTGSLTNSFATTSSPSTYYTIIESLATTGATASDIASIDLVITDALYSITAPQTRVHTTGSSSLAGVKFSQSIVNDGAGPVTYPSGVFLFADAKSRVYNWTFATSSAATALAVGDRATLSASAPSLDTTSTTSTLAVVLVDWDVATTATVRTLAGGDRLRFLGDPGLAQMDEGISQWVSRTAALQVAAQEAEGTGAGTH